MTEANEADLEGAAQTAGETDLREALDELRRVLGGEPASESAENGAASESVPPAVPTTPEPVDSPADLREALDELRRILDVERSPLHPSRHRARRVVLTALTVAAVAAGGAVAVRANQGSAPPPPDPRAATPSVAPSAAPPRAPSVLPVPGLPDSGPGVDAPGSVVRADLSREGLEVVEQVRLDGGTTSLSLAMPDLSVLGAKYASMTPQVSDLEVTVNGGPAEVDQASPTSWAVRGPSGAEIGSALIRYRVTGIVGVSTPSASGRGYALVAPLTGAAAFTSGDPVHVWLPASGVIQVNCPTAIGLDNFCGTPTEEGGGWRAALTPQIGAPIAFLQVDLNAL